VVDYRLGQDVLESLVEAMRVSTRIFFASGARRVHAPAAPEVAIEASEQDRIDELITMDGMKAGRVSVTSAHPMGGCRMGSDPETSVTDAWGQVHGLPWLFVADASLFPACSKLNPYITVMALADRVAERVRSRVQATP
jgi:choline dehydrogenase-like flavoprotein